MRRQQVKRHIDERIIKPRRLRREQIEPKPPVQERIGVVPMVIAQIPVGVLPERHGQRTESERCQRPESANAKRAGRDALAAAKDGLAMAASKRIGRPLSAKKYFREIQPCDWGITLATGETGAIRSPAP